MIFGEEEINDFVLQKKQCYINVVNPVTEVGTMCLLSSLLMRMSTGKYSLSKMFTDIAKTNRYKLKWQRVG